MPRCVNLSHSGSTSYSRAAESVAALDVLCSYAVVSIENNYCRPMMANDSVIEIKDGRHPVVEKMVNEILFTPNDVYLDVKSNRLMIITGPNMSGKSTFMRQVAVIVLMAQIGLLCACKLRKTRSSGQDIHPCRRKR